MGAGPALPPPVPAAGAYAEKSVIVFGSMEAALTPLMEQIERDHPGVKVFSLPSVDHPEYGRHIDLGVKGDPALVEAGLRAAAGRAARPWASGWAPNWCAERLCTNAVQSRDAPDQVHCSSKSARLP